MADTGRLDELKRKFDENPRRYFAPLANEYRKNGEFDQAIELCRAYLPHQPGHMSGYIVYGQSLFDAGRGHEAAEIFQQALQLDPENVIALRHLGDIARTEGNKALAMQWYGRVLELDPKNEEITAYITGLATPGASVRTPDGPERPVPPTIRPEPEHVDDAVALADLMEEPDAPQPAFEATGWSGVQSAQETRESKFAPPRVVEPTEEIQPQGVEHMFDIVASGESAVEPSITHFLNDRSTGAFEYVPPEVPSSESSSFEPHSLEQESSEQHSSDLHSAELHSSNEPQSTEPLYELSAPEDVLPPLLEPDMVAHLQEMERQLHAEMGTEPGVPVANGADDRVGVSTFTGNVDYSTILTAFESMRPLDPAVAAEPAAAFADISATPSASAAHDDLHEVVHEGTHEVTTHDSTHDVAHDVAGNAQAVTPSEPEYEREPEPEEPLDIGTPFITETMAMLYLQQGFTAEALDVYRKLAATRDEPRLHDKVRELEAQLASAPASSRTGDDAATGVAASGETVRAFFARIGARRPDARNVVHAAASGAIDDSVVDNFLQRNPGHTSTASGLGALFQSAPVDERDVRAAESLSGAFTARP